ncbi:MAG: transcriptional regulator, TetR family, partial [Acidimicrobiales bacterium]|nr:transcriptional regulator, TetR family [Acidimicrobiales bacterium]
AFVEIYLRGRTNTAVHAFGREHNLRIARAMRELAVDSGLASPDLPEQAVVLAVEVGDRVFQLAYERDQYGDAFVIEEGIAMVAGYLRGFATPAGIEGIRP